MNSIPNYLYAVDKAMLKPLENASAEWFKKNRPNLKNVELFKTVEQNFVGVVMKNIEFKNGMRENMKKSGRPQEINDKEFSLFWQLFEDLMNKRIAMLETEFAQNKKPDMLAKIMSYKLVTKVFLGGISDQGKLLKMLVEETTKLYDEITKLLGKR